MGKNLVFFFCPFGIEPPLSSFWTSVDFRTTRKLYFSTQNPFLMLSEATSKFQNPKVSISEAWTYGMSPLPPLWSSSAQWKALRSDPAGKLLVRHWYDFRGLKSIDRLAWSSWKYQKRILHEKIHLSCGAEVSPTPKTRFRRSSRSRDKKHKISSIFPH